MTAPTAPDWSAKTYLVIDDFSTVHRMLRDMLHKLSAVAIDTVKNGADAITLLQQKQYDVVLCDYNFAEGPNGQQILEEAKHRELVGLTCIWIMVSSEKAVETVMGAAELAPDGYILKPPTESMLLARLNRAWDKKQAFTAIDRAYAARDYHKAVDLCDQRLATDRLHAADLLRMKASLLLKCGEPQGAQSVYEQALLLREPVWAKAGLARIEILCGRYAAAKERLQEIIRDHPSFLDAYDQLAQTLQQTGEARQSLDILRMAVHLSPNSVLRQKNLGEIALQLGELHLAEQAFRSCIELGEYSILKTPDAYFGLARVFGKSNQPEAALDILDTARQAFEGDQVSLRAKIMEKQIYEDIGQYEQAAQKNAEIERHLQETSSKLGAETALESAQMALAIGNANKLPAIHRTHNQSTKPAIEIKTADGLASPITMQAETVPASHPSAPQLYKDTATSAATGTSTNAVSSPQLTTLLHRAHALIQYMERNGSNPVSTEETRAVLSRAEKLAPRHERIQQLQAMLCKINAEPAC